jgi:hypothetical protein
MKIFATPDNEDEEFDPVDPLGAICIEDDDGNQLLERCIWLDEWFGALVAGLQAITSGKDEAAIEMGSLRDPLVWKVEQDRITIAYKKRNIVIRDPSVFAALLRRTVIEFTEHYLKHENWPKCTDLWSVREWAERRS